MLVISMSLILHMVHVAGLHELSVLNRLCMEWVDMGIDETNCYSEIVVNTI